MAIFRKREASTEAGESGSRLDWPFTPRPTGGPHFDPLPDSTGAAHMIELRHVSKSFGAAKVLSDLTFYIRQNEFMTLLGPSGCGKSTTLRILAGFEQPDYGDVLFAGRSILNTPPYQRPLNTVFQRYALFPHLNVWDNIAFGLHIRHLPPAQIKTRIDDALRMVDLQGYADRWVDQLSGGQMQRVAIARAIVNKPQVLLLDEPLGALDLKMRKGMQLELKAMQRNLGITFVYVTHDQEEALTMSDTIIVMNQGVIQQIGRPIDIYNEPRNAFVADFIGESNILAGQMDQDYQVHFCGRNFSCVDKRKPAPAVDVVVRPEDIQFGPPGEQALNGVVDSVVFKGVHYEMVIRTEHFSFLVQSVNQAPAGSTVGLIIAPDAIHIMEKSAWPLAGDLS